MIANLPIIGYKKKTATTEEIIRQWDEIFTNTNSLYRDFYIFNYSSILFNFTRPEIDIFINYLQTKKEIIKNKKIGIITTNPRATCFFILIESEVFHSIKAEIKVFSTERAVESWVFSI